MLFNSWQGRLPGGECSKAVQVSHNFTLRQSYQVAIKLRKLIRSLEQLLRCHAERLGWLLQDIERLVKSLIYEFEAS